MIRGQFVLFVEEDLTKDQKRALEFLLAHALGDFRRAREHGDARAYVTKRYDPKEGPFGPPGSPRFEHKVAEVQQRIQLADELHNAVLGIEVRVVPDLYDDEPLHSAESVGWLYTCEVCHESGFGEPPKDPDDIRCPCCGNPAKAKPACRRCAGGGVDPVKIGPLCHRCAGSGVEI